MEHLFSPCTRLHDTLESQGGLERLRRRHPEPLQELNLDVSTEEFLSAERAFTFADLYAMLGGIETVAWLTPNATVARGHGLADMALNQLEESYRSYFTADGKDLIAFARSTEHLLEICDVILRLLAVSVVQSVRLSYDTLINVPSLAYLMEQCQSLKLLTLDNLAMLDEDIIRVLGAYSRPGLEIVLKHCNITSAGASALAEVLGHNQGSTKLDLCYIDNVVLADGLRGNSRLKSLKLLLSYNFEVRNREVLEIACALKENKGLVDLDLSFRGFWVTDETWCAICDSLHAHPTLEVLNLLSLSDDDDTMTSAVPTSRIQALVDMMKVNMSIHTIHLHDRLSHHELFLGSVIPYLETNRFRPRVRAIQQTRPIPYRAKVLGRALLAVRTDPNRFWMLLSGNAEVAFPSSTTTTTPAASLSTPATVGACVNAATVAANHVNTDHPASNVAALASGQKRKGCP
jgi:hypothetical protein